MKRWLKRTLIGTGVAVAALGGVAFWLTRPQPNITVASWGEEYGRAQMVAMFHPFVDSTGIDVDATIYGGGLEEVRGQVERGAVEWDVVDFDLADAQQACREGLLERVDDLEHMAGANGARASADFIPGALGPCWVGTSVYSQLVAYDPRRFESAPTQLADFFDLARFPGPRSLRDNGPMGNLELALMADHVGAQNVYPMLATKEGQDRAFAKLDTIKSAIVWWRRLAEPIDGIANGQIAMATTLNGRIYEAVNAGREIAPLWDGQLYQMDVFGVLKGTRNLARARRFLVFAAGSEALAQQAKVLPFGPARRSAAELVGRDPEHDRGKRRFHPTAAENFRNALALNPGWWAENGAELRARWNTWRGE
jgi:putative spermidine/putrescine transport system substrate-binding protein